MCFQDLSELYVYDIISHYVFYYCHLLCLFLLMLLFCLLFIACIMLIHMFLSITVFHIMIDKLLNKFDLIHCCK